MMISSSPTPVLTVLPSFTGGNRSVRRFHFVDKLLLVRQKKTIHYVTKAAIALRRIQLEITTTVPGVCFKQNNWKRFFVFMRFLFIFNSRNSSARLA
jgi:hypothetical protein